MSTVSPARGGADVSAGANHTRAAAFVFAAFCCLALACADSGRDASAETEPFARAPRDYFPTSVGLTWTYAITIGRTDPTGYSYVRWPVDAARRMGFSNRHNYRALVGGTNEGKQFALVLRVAGAAAAQGELTRAHGVEVAVDKDELGVLQAHKQMFWATSGDAWAQTAGEDQRFVVEQIVTFAPDDPMAPAAGMVPNPPQTDGNSVQLFMFADAPGTRMGPDGVDESLTFVGAESVVWNTRPVSALHFVRHVEPAADSPNGRTQAKAGNLGKAFTEDSWFVASIGLVRLIQKVGEQVSMTWELTARGAAPSR